MNFINGRRIVWVLGVSILGLALAGCGPSPMPPNPRIPIIPSRLVDTSAYYPYIESVDIPEGPFKPGDEFEVHLKLYFPEGTPTDLVLSKQTTMAGLYESYPVMVGQFWHWRELAFVRPDAPPLSGRGSVSDLLDKWEFNGLGDAVYHVPMAMEISRVVKLEPGYYEEEPLGKGVLAFLSASKPEYAGLIQWKVPSDRIDSLNEQDLKWWNEHAYADGKLKWFYYEYPVSP